MIEEMLEFESLLLKINGFKIVKVIKDLECPDYSGYNFELEKQRLKFRKAKVTPKKVGQFVTLWKRDLSGQTVPYGIDDGFDFHIIMIVNAPQIGFFVFPKEILASMGILSAYGREGKRGFRVYPEWDVPLSNQGLRTKGWMSEYFIDINDEEKAIERLRKILMPI
jgi:hypothetical protein